MNLDGARSRMADYLEEHGGRVTVSRKDASGWSVVASDLPAAVMMQTQGGSADAFSPIPGIEVSHRLTTPYGTDIRTGDRVTVSAPEGSSPGVLTVTGERHMSLEVTSDFYAVIEQSGVEAYAVTIQRYVEASDSYVDIWSGMAQASTTDMGISSLQQQGESGSTNTGTLTLDPAPDVTIGVGDWILGIPWATGAVVTRVQPVTGNRQDFSFTYTFGSVR